MLGFQEYFTRASDFVSKAPSEVIVSPCWGRVEALSEISEDGMIPGKSVFGRRHFISLSNMIKTDSLRSPFLSGMYIKIYLAQWDPHGVSAPASGTVLSIVHERGRSLPLLLMKGADLTNEKSHILFRSVHGFPILVSMIGSFLVRSNHVVCNEGETCERGQAVGSFRLGSTVVLLFPKNSVQALCKVQEKVKLGDPIAICK